MNTPYKMKGKSPMMKALIGGQKNLGKNGAPELQAAIEDSPARKDKKGMSVMDFDDTQQSSENPKISNEFGPGYGRLQDFMASAKANNVDLTKKKGLGPKAAPKMKKKSMATMKKKSTMKMKKKSTMKMKKK